MRNISRVSQGALCLGYPLVALQSTHVSNAGFFRRREGTRWLPIDSVYNAIERRRTIESSAFMSQTASETA